MVPGGPTISCPINVGRFGATMLWKPVCARTSQDVLYPLQGLNGDPEKGGVVPQATQTMQDRVVAFQLPAVLPERVPDGLEHASPSSLWAAYCLSFKVGLSPLPPSLPPNLSSPTMNLPSLKPIAAVGPLAAFCAA